MSDTESKLGMAPNVAGALCNAPCCIGFVFSIIAVVVEKENRFIKFHAFQSLLLHGVGIVCGVGLQFAALVAGMFVWGLGGLISFLGLPLAFALLGIEIFLMIKANGNEEFRLPVIGDMAAKWAV
jgi:uncharacterized membrane protein